ncbi:hypothetical protein EAPG_02374 [Escherichia albertii B156]|nr:hypothetical protein EAPG_02374 [Escherichia albertii B156]
MPRHYTERNRLHLPLFTKNACYPQLAGYYRLNNLLI